MKTAMRLLCLLLCLMMALPAAAEETAAQSEAAAPTLRVLLRRLNMTDRADLTLDGVYAAQAGNGTAMAFPRGSQVIVQIRDGALYLFYQGMSLCAGSSLTLTQSQPLDGGSVEGIRFAEGGAYYPGSLSLTVEGGLLVPVLTLSVEDYLLGVVPYEMSNAFPLEALKAQAVCARTYALSHVDAAKAYDVVDTTNDQVFKGVDPAQTNCIQAVRETAGVVGTYGGSYASCYYSASNGGQTELVENVWSGRGDWSYYKMVDDPYDLENPESVVKRARLKKNGDDLPADFTAVLSRYMEKELKAAGFDTSAAAFRVDAITAVSLGKAKFAAPSRMMSELTLTFQWSGRSIISQPSTETPIPASTVTAPPMQDSEILLFATPSPAAATPETVPDSIFASPAETAAPTPEPTPIYSEFTAVSTPAEVTLPLFPEVVRALKLSISGGDNEMITLSENGDAFVLEARRYGHGVGMSQRGAQWMAGKYSKSFQEILAFYYPGMELRRVASGSLILPTVQPALAQTPAPAATPTPRPTLMPVTGQLPEGAYLASVEGVDDDSSLNLRAEPNTGADILMRLYKHQKLVVLEACDEEGWVKVKTDAIEGYVMESFLERLEGSTAP